MGIDHARRTASIPAGRGATWELVTAAVAGDGDATEQLISRYSPLVRSVVRSCGIGGFDAEDIVQETWLIMLSQLRHVRKPEALGGWLKVIARRRCYNTYRQRSRVSCCADLAEELVGSDDPCEAALRAEGSLLLSAALGSLNARERALIDLLSEARPYREISAILAMPVGSIGPTRERVLRKLLRHAALQPDPAEFGKAA